MSNFEPLSEQQISQAAGGEQNFEFAGIACPVCGCGLRRWKSNPDRLDCQNAHICDSKGNYIRSLIF